MRLGLILEGSGASDQCAALRIPALALSQVGTTVRTVPYPAWRPVGDEETRRFASEVAETVRAVLAEDGWESVTVVAKSLGTIVLSAMDTSVFASRPVAGIWVTPLLGLDHVSAGIASKPWPTLLIAGGADPYHDSVAHEELVRTTGADSLVLPGADHLLEVSGDVLATIETLSRLAAAVLSFAHRPFAGRG